MGCCGQRRKATLYHGDHKWGHINLCDFKLKGCFPPFVYAYLLFSLLLSVAVYAVDTFTAVNLLAFNRWSSQIVPAIGFGVSKWIFSICIILSFINLGFEHFRAMRVMKRGNIAECYLDQLAVRLESVRFGKSQGWRRFLVFTELTRSKSFVDYIALFTHFSFQTWIQVLVCSGPRQVVNAFTLKAVYDAQKIVIEGNNVGDGIKNFFDKIEELANADYQQALILSAMCFTLVVWVFSFVFLLVAIIFYLFLSGKVRRDGGLTKFCQRKVNTALTKIVTKTIDKAIQKEEQNRFRAEAKAAKKNGEKFTLDRQATLPTLPNVGMVGGDKLPEMPTLQRNETTTTLPLYTSRPGTPGSFELNAMDQKRPMPARTGTMSSSTTYSSRAPLMGGASDTGFGGPQSPASMPSTDLHYYPPVRPGTSNSQRSLSRPHMPSNSASSFGAPYMETPATYASETMPPFPQPVRSPTAPMDSYGRPVPRDNFSRPSPTGRPPFERNSGSDGRASPAAPSFSNRGGPMPRNPGPANPPTYQPYHPNRSVTGPVPTRALPSPPHRNMTAPMPQRQQTGDYFDRQRPSQGSGFSYDYDAEGQRDRRY